MTFVDLHYIVLVNKMQVVLWGLFPEGAVVDADVDVFESSDSLFR